MFLVGHSLCCSSCRNSPPYTSWLNTTCWGPLWYWVMQMHLRLGRNRLKSARKPFTSKWCMHLNVTFGMVFFLVTLKYLGQSLHLGWWANAVQTGNSPNTIPGFDSSVALCNLRSDLPLILTHSHLPTWVMEHSWQPLFTSLMATSQLFYTTYEKHIIPMIWQRTCWL